MGTALVLSCDATNVASAQVTVSALNIKDPNSFTFQWVQGSTLYLAKYEPSP